RGQNVSPAGGRPHHGSERHWRDLSETEWTVELFSGHPSVPVGGRCIDLCCSSLHFRVQTSWMPWPFGSGIDAIGHNECSKNVPWKIRTLAKESKPNLLDEGTEQRDCVLIPTECGQSSLLVRNIAGHGTKQPVDCRVRRYCIQIKAELRRRRRSVTVDLDPDRIPSGLINDDATYALGRYSLDRRARRA